eukprot:jgi/Chrzof1/12379/Cz06g32100.t1
MSARAAGKRLAHHIRGAVCNGLRAAEAQSTHIKSMAGISESQCPRAMRMSKYRSLVQSRSLLTTLVGKTPSSMASMFAQANRSLAYFIFTDDDGI